jgi:hypothetical protein
MKTTKCELNTAFFVLKRFSISKCYLEFIFNLNFNLNFNTNFTLKLKIESEDELQNAILRSKTALT